MLFRNLVAAAATLVILIVVTLPVNAWGQGKVDMWDEDLPVRAAWLREHMPEDALIYLRIPNLMGLLAVPKGNALDPALRSSANVENVIKLQQGLVDNVFIHLPIFQDPALLALQTHLRSPIEVAAFARPAPSALLSANLSLESDQALYDLFDAFAMIDPNFAMVGPMDDDGIGSLVVSGMPAVFNFDADSGQLLVNMGPGANATGFAGMRAQMEEPNPTHAMRAMEDSIDASGYGPFFWIDAENALSVAQVFLPPEELQEMMDAGVDELRAAAFGWGSANGKSRLALAMDIKPGGEREFLPYVSNELQAKSVGDPDALALVSIPTAEEFARIEALALEEASPESQTDWFDTKREYTELTGTTFEELLSAIGPEVIMIFDRAGDYAAVQVRNERLWNDVVKRLAKSSGTDIEKHRISGTTYYHWDVPGEFAWLDEEALESMGWLGQILQHQRDHIYWIVEDGYLYVASIPQILMDRESMGAKTDVGQWLRESQRVDATEAVLSVVGTSRKLPRRYYAAYVEILQVLGDLAQTDLDIWSMPTAEQLGLPEKGTLGFTLRFGDPIVAMELTFENNPIEPMVSGGAGTIAVVGILAAIAIPAYEDYTTRAQVSEGLQLAAEQKQAVAESYFDKARFPDASEADAMSVYEYAGEYTWSVVVMPDTGVIEISYDTDTAPEGEQMFLEPQVDAGGAVFWTCSATFADKHIPAICRE